ncbi:MAG: helix-turn-helix transcriptional regulator [Bacilli bacterium]|nr:helix-turn-helix transcriptional regulator [Bacilli bacterium]
MSYKQIDTRQVGQAIKSLRVKNNLTQEQLADTIGYSVRTLRRIETDGTNSIETINTFAETFDVSAMDILNGCFLFVFKSLIDYLYKIKKALVTFAIQHLL